MKITYKSYTIVPTKDCYELWETIDVDTSRHNAKNDERDECVGYFNSIPNMFSVIIRRELANQDVKTDMRGFLAAYNEAHKDLNAFLGISETQ